jgi:hypothetical protein
MPLLTQIARRPVPDLLLAAEAVFLLAFFRVCLALFPVKKIIHTLTRTPQSPAATLNTATALRVRWAVEAVSRNSPAAFVCFPQTLAGYTMLRRRKTPSTIVYGVARSADSDAKLIAHTWLTVGELGEHILLGGEGASAFSAIERWT